jgi:hypothetical protein
MIGQQKTVHTRTKRVSVNEHCAHASRIAEADMMEEDGELAWIFVGFSRVSVKRLQREKIAGSLP